MAEQLNESKINPETSLQPTYVPDGDERVTINKILDDFTTARTVQNKSYNQFNGRTLFEAVDDWTKRWNGYIPPASILIDSDQSRIFLNFTRNQIISYLAKVAVQKPKAKIKAVNKKTGMVDVRFADVLSDLNQYSLEAENGEARFLETALEVTVKGTVVSYEGYRKETQDMEVPISYDAETGKIKTKKEERVIFDNCYQEVVPLEDFYIANPYQPDVQKQPFVIWRRITTHSEASSEFAKFKKWDYVKGGNWSVAADPTTFYRNTVVADLQKDQVEILRYYNRKKGIHRILANGVLLYDGPIPFKDGKYPFAKTIYEPFDNFFFWGAGFPNKIMGEQDLQNTFINMMADKTFGSLLPYGLSSDVDDIIEDDILQPNKIRKVGDISKWKFDTLPGVSSGEQGMFQLILNLARDNAGDMTGAAGMTGPKGGKVSARQAVLKQQELIQRLGFNMNFLEDFERDRTDLRIHHILQFYSIPKIEKITGKKGKEIEQMTYREVRLDNSDLSDGKKGTRIIKLIDGDSISTPDKKMQVANELSVKEAMGHELKTPVEALAVSVDTFRDYNFSISIVRNSSFSQNQVLDQAVRHEYANFRMQLMGTVGYPVNMDELVDWVNESYDIDTERFKGQAPAGQPGQNPGQEQNPGGAPDLASKMKPQKMPSLDGML